MHGPPNRTGDTAETAMVCTLMATPTRVGAQPVAVMPPRCGTSCLRTRPSPDGASEMTTWVLRLTTSTTCEAKRWATLTRRHPRLHLPWESKQYADRRAAVPR